MKNFGSIADAEIELGMPYAKIEREKSEKELKVDCSG